MENLNRFPREWICSGENALSKHEFLVYCAYDRSHRILNHRYSAHLQKCRTNYEVRKASNGEKPLWVSCRYNVEHKMYEPELQYHEHNCTDKKLPWLKSLYFANVRLFEAMLRLDEEAEQIARGSGDIGKQRSAQLDKSKGSDVGNGVFDNSSANPPGAEALNEEDARNAKIIADLIKDINNSAVYDIDVPPSEICMLTSRLMKMVKDRPSPNAVEDVKASEATPSKGSAIFAHDELAISQLLDPDSFGYKRRPVRRHRRTVLSMFKQQPPIFEEPGDSDDDWKLVGKTSTSFDWLQHLHNLKRPIRLIPPGLTKAQRKKYEIAITERLKYEEGIFVEEEEVMPPPREETNNKRPTSLVPAHPQRMIDESKSIY